MFDTTFHINDLLTLAGVVGTGSIYLGKVVRASIKEHIARLDAHEDELSLHAGVLQSMGWRRPPESKFKPRHVAIVTKPYDTN